LFGVNRWQQPPVLKKRTFLSWKKKLHFPRLNATTKDREGVGSVTREKAMCIMQRESSEENEHQL